MPDALRRHGQSSLLANPDLLALIPGLVDLLMPGGVSSERRAALLREVDDYWLGDSDPALPCEEDEL